MLILFIVSTVFYVGNYGNSHKQTDRDCDRVNTVMVKDKVLVRAIVI